MTPSRAAGPRLPTCQASSPRCELEHGPGLHAETARRLACDSSLVAIAERDGEPLSVGRKTRSIPPAVRRALRSRDGGCRFPGCTAHRFVDAHHIEHWADGGTTELANLVHLCRRHHRLVYEGRFRLEARAGRELVFRRPDGTALPASPPLPGARPSRRTKGQAVAGTPSENRRLTGPLGRCGPAAGRMALDLEHPLFVLLQDSAGASGAHGRAVLPPEHEP